LCKSYNGEVERIQCRNMLCIYRLWKLKMPLTEWKIPFILSSSSSSRALQSVLDYGFQHSFLVLSSEQICFYEIGVSTQCPTPNLEDQGVSLSLEPHSWPVLSWETLPVATLPPAELLRSLEHASPAATTRWRHHGGGGLFISTSNNSHCPSHVTVWVHHLCNVEKIKINFWQWWLVARIANEAMVVPVMGCGKVCIWQESGVRWLVLCWCFLQESGFSHREDVFTFNLFFKEIFFNFVLSVQFAKIMLQ
jgi:hypothetical protein